MQAILKHEKTQDGIAAWADMKKAYAFDGSKQVKIR